MTLLTVLLIPFVAVAFVVNVFTGGKKFKTFFDESERFANSAEYFSRIEVEVVDSTDSTRDLAEVQSQVRALIEKEDWQALSLKIQTWDQERAVCSANIPLAEVAQQTVLEDLAAEIYEGHICHPDPIMYFEDEVVERLEKLAFQTPDSYPLLALAMQMRCAQGWTHRGAEYAAYVSDEGWFGMAARFEMAAKLLEGVDPIALDAPLLAQARHKLLAFMPNAHSHVRQFYQDWSELVPISTTPHKQHAMMMLPRWFGSDHELQIEAAQAAALTQYLTGETAYFVMYRTALDDWDPNVLSMDCQRFSQGALDFLTLRGNDPAVVGNLIDNMIWWSTHGSSRGLNPEQKIIRDDISAHLVALRHELIRTRLTAVFPEVWNEGEETCMFAILEACTQELDQGQNLVVGSEGIVFLPPDEVTSSECS